MKSFSMNPAYAASLELEPASRSVPSKISVSRMMFGPEGAPLLAFSPPHLLFKRNPKVGESRARRI